MKPPGLDPGNSLHVGHHWSLSCCSLVAIWMTSFACLASCSAPGAGEGSSVPTFCSYSSICTPLLCPVFGRTGLSFPLDCTWLTHPHSPAFIHSFVLRVDAEQEEIPGLYAGLKPHDHCCGHLVGGDSLRTLSCEDKGEEVDKNHAADASTECIPCTGLVTQFPLCPLICHNLSSLPGQLLGTRVNFPLRVGTNSSR